MNTYFNLKTVYGTETIDQLSAKDFKTLKEYSQERKRLLNEYHIAGFNVYLSQRAAKN